MIALDVIMFDVDGTLVDSAADIVKAMNYTLRLLGMSERPPSAIASYIGTGVKDLVKKSLGSENERSIRDGVGIFSKYYVDDSADRSKLYPHVKEVLEHFKDKRKLILTNRYTRFADITLKEMGIRDHF